MIYIQQANGLQPISQQLTKEKIIAALGYTPADNTTLWEDKSGNLIVADENGYVIARIDANGLETVGVRTESILLGGEDLGEKLDALNNKSVDLTNYYTKDEVDKALSEVDTDVNLSNYYTKEEVDEAISNVDVDLGGYATEDFVTQKIQESENNREDLDLADYALVADVEEHTVDEDVHISAAERSLWNSKSDFSGNYADLKNAPNITTNDNDDELLVCDSAGNVIMRVNANGINVADIFLNGVSLEKKNPLAGKRISILGDSISTYSGYIPSGYATYYPRGDVNSVDKTWWQLLIHNNNMIMGQNVSYSGSTVQSDGTYSYLQDDRITALGVNGAPDIVIIEGSTNDGQIEDLTASGEIVNTLPTLPLTNANQSIYDTTTFVGAYQALIEKVMLAYPNAKICCWGTPWPNSTSYITASEAIKATEKIEALCKMYGCVFLDIRQCGINPVNVSNYMIDSLHPNAAGMELIANYIEKCLA